MEPNCISSSLTGLVNRELLLGWGLHMGARPGWETSASAGLHVDAGAGGGGPGM